jgi:hypothetical protein
VQPTKINAWSRLLVAPTTDNHLKNYVKAWTYKTEQTPAGLAIKYKFCSENLARIENNYLSTRCIFSDKVTFHISRKVKWHDVCVWEYKFLTSLLNTKEMH